MSRVPVKQFRARVRAGISGKGRLWSDKRLVARARAMALKDMEKAREECKCSSTHAHICLYS